MYTSYIVKRTQIYLAERQAEELGRRAAARGVTASRMIREAIDEYLAGPDDDDHALRRFHAALREGFGAAPSLSSGAAYVDDLRQADRDRQAELDHRAER